jgi:two-component system, OmpR family, KDP operon response regulator KdpE
VSEGRILVVDDDPQLRRTMRTALSASHYEVEDARNGEESLEKLRSGTYDLVLLDINMPLMTGIETCKAIRAGSEVAIIMLTVRNSEGDKVSALDSGADDYITKPFSTPELLARIRAALRRLPVPPAARLQRVSFENLEIDFAAHALTVNGRTTRLTPKELDLLAYLVAHPNTTIGHRELLQAVWGPDYGQELEYLRVFINRLRKKLEPDPGNPRFLITDAWAGYRFCPPR